MKYITIVFCLCFYSFSDSVRNLNTIDEKAKLINHPIEACQSKNWELLKDSALGFEIKFPSKPKKEITFLEGNLKQIQYSITEMNTNTLSIMIFVLPKRKIEKEQLSKMYENGINNITKENGAKFSKNIDFYIGDLYGKEYEATSNDNKLKMTGRVLYRSGFLYVWNVVIEDEKISSNVNRFLNSFALMN